MSCEWPVGIAYKELEVLDGSDQTIQLMLETDSDGDGKPEEATDWHAVLTGKRSWDAASHLPPLKMENESEFHLTSRLEILKSPR